MNFKFICWMHLCIQEQRTKSATMLRMIGNEAAKIVAHTYIKIKNRVEIIRWVCPKWHVLVYKRRLQCLGYSVLCVCVCVHPTKAKNKHSSRLFAYFTKHPEARTTWIGSNVFDLSRLLWQCSWNTYTADSSSIMQAIGVSCCQCCRCYCYSTLSKLVQVCLLW